MLFQIERQGGSKREALLKEPCWRNRWRLRREDETYTTPATGHRPPATGPRPPASRHGPPATGHRLQPPATGHRPPATGHRPAASGHRPNQRPSQKKSIARLTEDIFGKELQPPTRLTVFKGFCTEPGGRRPAWPRRPPKRPARSDPFF